MTDSALSNDIHQTVGSVDGHCEPVHNPYYDNRIKITLSANMWEPYAVDWVEAEERGYFLSKERQNALREMDAAMFS